MASTMQINLEKYVGSAGLKSMPGLSLKNAVPRALSCGISTSAILARGPSSRRRPRKSRTKSSKTSMQLMQLEAANGDPTAG